MSPARFVREVLVDRLRVGELVIGYDHGFGKDRKGDVDTLRGLAGELGFVVDVVGPVAVDTEAVSSTAVRRAVETGDLEAAARGLGRPYSVLGRVARGAGRGRELGYPTANLEPGRRKCLPPTGVYAVRVEVEGVEWPAMANLGPRPTFGDARAGLEVHLLDWPGEELYGARLHVEFVERLRGVLRFGDPAELAAQLAEDRARARAALGRGPIRATGVA
jgi:riboflavin kinase/FMN adenylyltransferase